MRKISATLICHNEEAKIERALQSLSGVVDEIVVVDSFSTDATLEICRRYTERVTQREWPGYRDQKQFAVERAAHDWILSLDADEALSPALRNEIQQWRTAADAADGYRIRRRTFFLGRWIDRTSWASDWQVRLFDRRQGRWEGGRVHESVKIQGEVASLMGVLEHYTYATVSEYLIQLENFSKLAALDARDAGRRSSWSRMLLLPPLEFFRNFLLRGGFLDGVPGLAVSTLSAVSVYFKYLALWELQQGLDEASKPPAEDA